MKTSVDIFSQKIALAWPIGCKWYETSPPFKELRQENASWGYKMAMNASLFLSLLQSFKRPHLCNCYYKTAKPRPWIVSYHTVFSPQKPTKHVGTLHLQCRHRLLCLKSILHMSIWDSYFTCDGSQTIQFFPLLFYICMVILPISAQA